MERYCFPARLTPDEVDGRFVVTFRDVKGAVTQGDSIEDALCQAADCLEEYIAFCLREGRDIPSPSRSRSGEYVVPVPALTAPKAALHAAMREAKLGNSKLARRLGCDEKDVRRMLDPRHNSRITTLQQALAVLGKQIVVGVKDAA